jgi:hypothetical protein
MATWIDVYHKLEAYSPAAAYYFLICFPIVVAAVAALGARESSNPVSENAVESTKARLPRIIFVLVLAASVLALTGTVQLLLSNNRVKDDSVRPTTFSTSAPTSAHPPLISESRDMARWERLSPRLFDGELIEANVCNTPLFRGMYCKMRNNELPETLAFWIGPSGGGDNVWIDYVDVRMTATKWVIKIQRAVPADTTMFTGSLAISNRPFVETLLSRIGFSRDILAKCVQRRLTFTDGSLRYGCAVFPLRGIDSSGFEFSVEIDMNTSTVPCIGHPICAVR